MMRLSLLLQKGRAFTLVELLVVISIVGLLAGLISVMVPRSIETAKKVKAKGDMVAIVAAIKAYKMEYGFYPRPPSKRFADSVPSENWGGWAGPWGSGLGPNDDCKAVMQILAGQNINLEGQPMNPKQIQFLEGVEADGAFIDPWGMAYSFKMDTSDSGGLEYYSLDGNTENIRVSVVAVSYGPDKSQSDPNLKWTKTFDDVFSWEDRPWKR
jgi:prepilin-type N-terminal cleavage/methylation domain-containing protein